MDSYLEEFKNRRKNKKIENTEPKKSSKLITEILLSIIFFLISIIYINKSDKNLLLYKEYVYTDSMPFTTIKTKYEELFGEVLPATTSKEKTVFNNEFVYKKIEDYEDGEKLTVATNSIISNIASGIVVFVGEKEEYGKTVIVQGIDGTDIWYGNLQNVSVSLYDYLEKETVLGEVNGEELYLVIKKDNEFIKYEEYKS